MSYRILGEEQMVREKAKRTTVRVLVVSLLLAFCFSLTIGCEAKERVEITVDFGTEKLIELQKTLESPVWVSTDETIATVDSKGVVKGVSLGSTVITAKVNDKPAATVNVTVKMAEIEMTVDYGTEKAIELKGNGTLAWTSSDEMIASVNNAGVVNGKAPGNAEITANQGDVVVAKVAVTVQIIEPTAIFLSTENVEMKIDELAQLSYVLMPENASDYGITWKSVNPAIAKVDEKGNVTAVTDGTTTIICSTANGQMATCSVTVLPRSAIEQLNENEKKLFDYMVTKWLKSFYNASAVRIRNLYWGGGNSEKILSVIADIQGMNRLGGYTYKYYGIVLYDGGGLALEAPSPDLTKPMSADEMDYTKINAALEEYWNSQGAH